MWVLPFRISPCVWYMLRPNHQSWFPRPNNVPVVKVTNYEAPDTQFPLFSCYIISLMSTDSTQPFVLRRNKCQFRFSFHMSDHVTKNINKNTTTTTERTKSFVYFIFLTFEDGRCKMKANTSKFELWALGGGGEGEDSYLWSYELWYLTV
jgi:hypothetical protein